MTVAKVTVSRKARHDLKEIGRYTNKRWGVEQRNIYLSMLDDCIQKIASRLIEGASCSHIRSGYRKQLTGSHLIYFRWITDDHVEIVRVLHERMDTQRHL